MIKLNRFPKMMVLQRYRAEQLWYPVDLAKAIWIAEATKYAIFKNFALSKRENIEKKLIATWKVENEKQLQQYNFDNIFKIHLKDNKPFVGGKIFSEQDYERYMLKFDEKTRKSLEKWGQKIIENTPEELLENENKFFNLVWKKHRDEDIPEI